MNGKKPGDISEKVRHLSNLAFFQGLAAREMGELAGTCVMIRVAKGHLFYRPEELSERIYILLEGSVHQYRISPDGKKLIIALLGPHALFDEATLVDSKACHVCFAEAAADCQVLVLSPLDLLHFIRRHPQVAFPIFEEIGERLHTLERRLENMAFKDLAGRLSETLLHLAQEQESTTVVGFTHQALAEMVGTYRETATDVLNQLQLQGAIVIGRKRIDILDPAKLATLAGVYEVPNCRSWYARSLETM